MKMHLRIEAFRELTLVTWDERVEGAERVRFSDEGFAERFLRRLLDEPGTEWTLRAMVGDGASRSFGDEGLDGLVREAAARLVDRRIKIYERTLTQYFSDVPPGVDAPEKPVDPGATDDPVEPEHAVPTPKNAPPAHWVLECSVEGERDDDCFDESTLRLRARLKDGTVTRTEATFTVLRNHAVIHSQSVPTANPSMALALPRVADDEASWTLEFRFQYGDDVYTGTRVYTVWPRTLRLRAQHHRSGAPVKGARFTVTQDEEHSAAETGDDGSVEHALAKPAPFTVDGESPWVVRAWVRETGRVREAKVERTYKAAFHNPRKPSPDKAIEQLVNHKTADKGRDGLGSTIVVCVGAEGDADRPTGSRVATEGDELFVKVLFARTSKRNSPLPAVTGLLDANTVGALTTGRVRIGAGGAAGEFTLELGLAGGDRCDVSVGVTAEARDQTISFVNWRKLYYQASYPSTSAMPPMARITTCLEGVFVRYEKYKDLSFSDSDGPPAGAWFDGPMMGLSAGKKVCIGDHNKAHFHAKFDDQKKPLGVHALVCHKQFDGGAVAHQSVVSGTVSKAADAKVKFPPGTGAKAWCHELDITTVSGSANVFPKAIQDGADAVRSATWTSLAASGPHQGATGAIPADHVHIDWVANQNVITVKLPAAAATAVDAGVTVRVDYTVLWALGEYLGESDGKRPNLQLLVDMENTSFNDVMAHELGHTMGAVLKAVPPGLSAGDHGWKYTGRGHQGPHCAFGAPKATFDNNAKNLTGLGAKCKCIMYGENSSKGSNSNGLFCEKCVPFLAAEALQDITT